MKYLLLTALFVASSLGQRRVEYEISFENAVHHEAHVTARFIGVPAGPVEVRMSRSSPGRYALQEYAKNVYSVATADGYGKHLAVSRPDPYQWNVSGHDGTVVVDYTLFADHANGTYAGFDVTHAHMNMPAVFMWASGFDDAPITITFRIPNGSGWKVATQLSPTGDLHTFTAPNLQYFMDSPTELSAFKMREWTVPSGDTTWKFRLALHDTGTVEQADVFAEMIKAVVLEQKAIFGELPVFDYGSYTFIIDYLPYVIGDGMEHRNSTLITRTRPLRTHAVENMGTVAHEFFHSWNVERMRPKSLEPFNFEHANMSGELWFAEGYTNYYGGLSLVRAGIISHDRYLRAISNPINQIITSPAHKYFSVVEMSEQAPLVDGVSAPDQDNRANTYISYYPYGEVLALALDLNMRSSFPGLSLDMFMREVWQRHGAMERPYTNEDLRTILGEVTKSPSFADEFFNRYIYGREVPDYEKLLASAGLLLRNSGAKKASLGSVALRFEDGKAVISTPTLINSPIYRAGLDRRDRIIKMDGIPISSQKDFDSVLAAHKPGESVAIEFDQRESVKTANIVLEEARQFEVVPYEQSNRELTESKRAFRNSWLERRASEPVPTLTKICAVCQRRSPFAYEFCQFDGDSLKVSLDQR